MYCSFQIEVFPLVRAHLWRACGLRRGEN